jgi:AraC family transcriptional regulator, regulatory protein of adaptative response / methylated-DNA-[protein]-cysteine methyltransferase
MTRIDGVRTRADNTIRFTVGECTLGSILVAMSEVGIRAMSFGDDPERLTRELRDGCRFGRR